jgi:hypothetical protein
MEKADGSEFGVGGCFWTPATERGADRAQKDPEYRTGDAHVVLQVRT